MSTPKCNQLGTVGVCVQPLSALYSLPLAKPVVSDNHVPRNRATLSGLTLGGPLGLWVVTFEDCRSSGVVWGDIETVSFDDVGGNRAPGSLEKMVGELGEVGEIAWLLHPVDGISDGSSDVWDDERKEGNDGNKGGLHVGFCFSEKKVLLKRSFEEEEALFLNTKCILYKEGLVEEIVVGTRRPKDRYSGKDGGKSEVVVVESKM